MHFERYIQIGMLATIAMLFSIIAFNNIIAFNSNWLFVQHVLSMDTTFREPSLMWRAITNPDIQRFTYYSIICWQVLTAVICWVSCLVMLANINKNSFRFSGSKNLAYIGLFFGFVLYMVGFIIIGGEWFSMWQSQTWNGQMKAGLFISLIMFVMIFLKLEKSE